MATMRDVLVNGGVLFEIFGKFVFEINPGVFRGK